MKRKNILKSMVCSVMLLNILANDVAKATENANEDLNTIGENESSTESLNTVDNAVNQPIEENLQPNSLNNEKPDKYYIEFEYENFNKLPEEVKATLNPKKEIDSYLGFLLPNIKKPEPIEVDGFYWELEKYNVTNLSDRKQKYTGIWVKKSKIEVSFSTDSPEGLPEDLKSKTYDSVAVIEGKYIPTPLNEEFIKGDIVWSLTWPKEKASSENTTIIGSWTSRPLTYEGSVTFVTKNGNQTVHFTNSSEEIQKTDDKGNVANQDDSGGGFNKAYFMGWSNVPNYDGSQEDAKLFYGHEAISRAFPNGFKGGEKLYAFYLTTYSAMSFYNELAGDLKINKNIDDLSTMFNKFEIANEDKQDESTYYVNNDLGDISLVNLGASFYLNPYITAAVRRSSYYTHPGNLDYGASPKDDFILNPLNLNNLKEKIKDLENKYTYVDLHVKLDSRIDVADKLNFVFKSYAFRPIAILRGDYSALMESEIVTPAEDPNSKIILTTNGEKEFIVRTRIRTKWDIPNATAEEAIKDMELISNSDQNFSISKENLLRIARGGADPIEINGHIQGGVNLYSVNMIGKTFGGPKDIKKKEANAKVLNFKPAYVVFNLNSPFKPDVEQNLGWSRVALNGSLDNDIFDMKEKPKYSTVPAENIVGEAMPDAPRIEDYNFEGYNTMADGSGTSFDGNTLVDKSMLTNGEVTVYAQWSTNVMFNKNSSSLDDTAEQNLASLAVKYNGNLNNDILRGGTVPTTTLEGYTFKEWNTKADGTGETLDLSRGVVRPVTYFAVWEKEVINPQPDPVPQPQPDPAPQPNPVPQPQPDPAPQPNPVPQPQPDPAPQPDPVPQPQPDPAPQPNPVPQPQPDPVPQPNPVPQTHPELISEKNKDQTAESIPDIKDSEKDKGNSENNKKIGKGLTATGMVDTKVGTLIIPIIAIAIFLRKRKIK